MPMTGLVAPYEVFSQDPAQVRPNLSQAPLTLTSASNHGKG